MWLRSSTEEQWSLKPLVEGSSPPGATTMKTFIQLLFIVSIFISSQTTGISNSLYAGVVVTDYSKIKIAHSIDNVSIQHKPMLIPDTMIENITYYPEDLNWYMKSPIDRSAVIYSEMCDHGGWWGDSCPSQQDLVSFILFEEGSVLDYNQKVDMAEGIRYRFDRYVEDTNSLIKQLSGFTAFYNPHWDLVLDYKDWNEIRDPKDLSSYISIVESVYQSDLPKDSWKYIFWFSESEVKTPKNKWDGVIGKDYIMTVSENGYILYFTGNLKIHRCAVIGLDCR